MECVFPFVLNVVNVLLLHYFNLVFCEMLSNSNSNLGLFLIRGQSIRNYMKIQATVFSSEVI